MTGDIKMGWSVSYAATLMPNRRPTWRHGPHGFSYWTLFDIWIFRDSSGKECCSPFPVVTDWDEF